MKRSGLAILLLLAAATWALSQAPALGLLQTVRLPGVHGRLDHMDVDVAGNRLFLSALGNNTLEVFDLRTARLIHTIGGLHEPQGVTYVPSSNLIFVANGGDGMVRIFSGADYRLLHTVRLASDADDTRYDAAGGSVIVGYGDEGDAGLAVLDGTTGALRSRIMLPAHPESFQLAAPGPAIFVNIPSAGNLVVEVDRTQARIVERWRLANAGENFPMALDEADHRLLIACRSPAALVVLDSRTGKEVARVAGVGHADDIWYDAAHRRILISGGDGFISVIAQQDADHYRALAPVRTAPGGRTSLLVPGLHRLYLGVWGRNGQPEELRVYALEP